MDTSFDQLTVVDDANIDTNIYTNSDSNNYLQQFPIEIQVLIVQHLAPVDIIHLGLTAKYFNENFCALDPHSIWKQLFERDISTVEIPYLDDVPSYRREYQETMNYVTTLTPMGIRKFAIDAGYEQILYNRIGPKRNSTYLNSLLFLAIPTERFDIVGFLISLGANDLNLALSKAARTGNLDLVEQILAAIEDGYLDPFDQPRYSEALVAAVGVDELQPGHLDIINRLLKLGANSYSEAMTMAARRGHLEIVQRMVTLGATQFNRALLNAASPVAPRGTPTGSLDVSRQLKVIDYLITVGATNFDGAMCNAARCGHPKIIEVMISRGANDFQSAMIEAATSGHHSIVESMIQLGADNFNMTMRAAARSGNVEIIRRMMEFGAKSFKGTFIDAAQCGHLHIVEWMVQETASRQNISNPGPLENGNNPGPLEKGNNPVPLEKGNNPVPLENGKENPVPLETEGNSSNPVSHGKEKSPTPLDFDHALRVSAQRGHRNIINYLLTLGARDFDNAMVQASSDDRHIDIINQMIDLGARSFDETFHEAAACGAVKVVELMIKLTTDNPLAGPLDFYGAFLLCSHCDANDKRKLRVMNILIQHRIDNGNPFGPSQFNVALLKAVRHSKYGNLDIIKRLIEVGATNINNALQVAMQRGYTKTVRYLQSVIATTITE